MTRPNTQAYDRRRKRAIADGTWLPAVPVDEVRPHVVALVDEHQMTQASIARAAEVDKNVIGRIYRREENRVHGPVAAQILAVEATPTPPADGLIDVIAARRMCQALAVIGYSIDWQSQRSGLVRSTLRQIRGDRPNRRGKPQRWITTEIDAETSLMYHQAPMESDEQDPRAVTWAVRKSWHGPFAWDDDTIRDRRARPYEQSLPRRTHVLDSNIQDGIAGRLTYDVLTTAERVIVVSRLSGTGWTARHIGEWLTWGDTSEQCRVNVTQFMSRHDIPAMQQHGLCSSSTAARLSGMSRVLRELTLR